MHDSFINYANVLTLLLCIEISHITEMKNIRVIFKDLVSWVKKTSLAKEVAFFKNCRSF